ncbi:MAG TPA: hypothetical protein VMT22_00195 [Terriglobales bacterium]|nr:hypothetical protein [Terriglobales bacterium]
MEWFVQKSHGSGFKGARTGVIVCVRCNEDDRDLPVGRNDLTLQIESTHAGHSHVENQAFRITRLIRTQERLRRRETLCLKSDRSDQIIERIPKRIIVVDNRNERNTGHEPSISFLWAYLPEKKLSRVSTAGGEFIVRGRKLLLDLS